MKVCVKIWTWNENGMNRTEWKIWKLYWKFENEMKMKLNENLKMNWNDKKWKCENEMKIMKKWK